MVRRGDSPLNSKVRIATLESHCENLENSNRASDNHPQHKVAGEKSRLPAGQLTATATSETAAPISAAYRVI
jgi:hypothetical protein